MPPKTTITKQDILDACIDLVRAKGSDALNARSIAAALGCSTQPVFSNFTSMEELRDAVIGAAVDVFQNYLQAAMKNNPYPPYKAGGMAYIKFAQEERALFQLLFMRDRSGEHTDVTMPVDRQMKHLVQTDTGLPAEGAAWLHLEMWAFVHGIAAMIATRYVTPDSEVISRMLTDVYQSLKNRYLED